MLVGNKKEKNLGRANANKKTQLIDQKLKKKRERAWGSSEEAIDNEVYCYWHVTVHHQISAPEKMPAGSACCWLASFSLDPYITKDQAPLPHSLSLLFRRRLRGFDEDSPFLCRAFGAMLWRWLLAYAVCSGCQCQFIICPSFLLHPTRNRLTTKSTSRFCSKVPKLLLGSYQGPV